MSIHFNRLLKHNLIKYRKQHKKETYEKLKRNLDKLISKIMKLGIKLKNVLKVLKVIIVVKKYINILKVRLPHSKVPNCRSKISIEHLLLNIITK